MLTVFLGRCGLAGPGHPEVRDPVTADEGRDRKAAGEPEGSRGGDHQDRDQVVGYRNAWNMPWKISHSLTKPHSGGRAAIPRTREE